MEFTDGWQIWRYVTAGGPLMPLLALVSGGIWFSFLRNRRSARVLMLDQEAWLDRWDAPNSQREADDDLRAMAVSDRPWALLMRRPIRKLLSGADVSAGFDLVEEDQRRDAGRRVLMLSALTAAAPLLGLLGTVMGMIQTFSATSAIGGDVLDRISEGIHTALITTQYGLIVAIPGVFGLYILRRMNRRLDVKLQQWRILLGARYRRST